MRETMTEPVAWQPYSERLWVTLARTGGIALAVGALLAWRWGAIGRWPLAALLAFWPTFGGHWVEVFFLNVLHPWLPMARGTQITARLGVWFVGGIVLALGMMATAMLLGVTPARWLAWWTAGV